VRLSIRTLLPKLHGGQQSLDAWLRSQSDTILVIRCGRRFGKTYYLASLALESLLRQQQVWWVSPTYRLARVGFGTLIAHIRKLPRPLRQHIQLYRSLPYRATFGKGWVEFLTTRLPDSLQGEGLDLIVYDEAATDRNLTEVIEQYLLPTTFDRNGRIILASTPKGANDFAHYCEQYPCYVAPTYANPLIRPETLERYRQQLEAEGRGYLYRQEVLAEIVKELGAFWERLPALYEGELPATAEVVGIDWGYSSPFAAVWVYRISDRYVVGHEVYRQYLSPDEQAKQVLRLPKARRYVCDPSVPEHVYESWRKAGLTPLPASRDRVGGWQYIRQLIAQGKLQVHKHCFHLLDEFQAAQAHIRKPDDLVGEDHALDALRYALTALPQSTEPKPRKSVDQWLLEQSIRRYEREVWRRNR
jgi:hypothetical protein